jgi:hypothetical protein
VKATKKRHHDEGRRQLLEEGVRSYLDAVTALIEFQKEVQSKCRRVLEKHVDDYSAALKLKEPLRKADIKPFVWPKFEKWDGKSWSIGAYAARRNIFGINYWEAVSALEYETEAGLLCWTGELYYPVKLAGNLGRRIHRLNPKVLVDGQYCYLQHDLQNEEAATFDTPLEALLQQWIRLWKKVGGMKEVFKA